MDDVEHTSERIGNFKATFLTKDGLRYLCEGLHEQRAEDIGYHAGEESHPVYKILGEGVCTLTVNGKTMTANVGQNLTIDTDRQLAYRSDGTLNNTAVTGNYEDLVLVEGDNKVTITDGFDLKVIPYWRYL